MMYQKIFSVIFLIFLFSCGCEKNPTQSVEYGEGDDYEIYQVVLMDCFSETDNLVILNDLTVLSCIDSFQTASFREQFPEIKDETITDFNLRNEERSQLKPIQDIDFYVFESDYKDSGQETASAYLSSVGYDEDKTQAIVEMGVTYAPLAGQGRLIYLTKIDGEWKISGGLTIWVS